MPQDSRIAALLCLVIDYLLGAVGSLEIAEDGRVCVEMVLGA